MCEIYQTNGKRIINLVRDRQGLKHSVSWLQNSSAIFTVKFHLRVLLRRGYTWCLKVNLKSSCIYADRRTRAILSSPFAYCKWRKICPSVGTTEAKSIFAPDGHRRVSTRGRCKWGSCPPNIARAFYNRHLRTRRFPICVASRRNGAANIFRENGLPRGHTGLQNFRRSLTRSVEFTG